MREPDPQVVSMVIWLFIVTIGILSCVLVKLLERQRLWENEMMCFRECERCRKLFSLHQWGTLCEIHQYVRMAKKNALS